jgi:hypothetical protein
MGGSLAASSPHRGRHGQFVIKHLYSKAHTASLSAQNISRSSIAFPKRNKGSKNKFQQLRNIPYKILLGLCPLTKNQRSHFHPGLRPTANVSKATAGFAAPPRAATGGARRGIGFSFSGRVYGATKATSFKTLSGSVPFNTLKANIDYSRPTQKTRNGT